MKVSSPIEPQLLSVGQAAAALGISIWTLRGWAYRGQIASHKVGKRLMISTAEVARIIRESERPRLASHRQD